MKKLLPIINLVLIIFFVGFYAVNSFSQLYKPEVLVRVGYFDMDRIINEYVYTREAKDKIEMRKQELDKELAPRKKRIEEMLLDLKKKEDELTEDERTKILNNINIEKEKLEIMKKKNRERLAELDRKLKGQILEHAYTTIKDVALKNKMNIIIENKYIYFATEDLDITDTVIHKMNMEVDEIYID